MLVKVRYEGSLSDLAERLPAFNCLHDALITQADWRCWQRKEGQSSSHDLQVVFLGKSGYGKSSIVNALAGHEVMETSDVQACTRQAQSAEFIIRPGNFLSFADLPGIGESQQRDTEYLRLYEQILLKADVVVYMVRADCRDYAIDEVAFTRLFPSSTARRKVILVVNGSDKIEPIQRHNSGVPSTEQLLYLNRKIESLRQIFPGVQRIVACSATTGWNIGVLSSEIVGLLAQSEGVRL